MLENKIYIILLIGILLVILLNYKNSMEPFTNNRFETQFRERQNQINQRIARLNNTEFNFNINNPLYSQACNLQNRIVQENNNVLNNTIEDNKINRLKRQVNELDRLLLRKNIRRDLKKGIKSIKSHNNGAEFGLIPVDNYSSKFLISANDGCIGISNNNYDIFRCNKNDASQQFNLKRVYNQYSYSRHSNNHDYVEDKNNIEFPFVMMKSVNGDKCLTNNNNNIRIMPCNMLKSQRFEPLEKNTCR